MIKKPINIESYKGRTLHGKVVKSGSMNKTIIVCVDRRVVHPVYKKTINKFSKFHVHDELNQCELGDVVLIKEARPISKTKSWVLLQILEKAAAKQEGVI